MPYGQPWNEAAPAGSDAASGIDTYIQNDKIAVRERMVSLGATGWATDDPVYFNYVQLGGATPYIIGNAASTEISIRDKTGATKQLVITDAGQATFNVPLTVASKNVANAEFDKGNVTGATTINWNQGNNQKMTFTGNVTFTFSNPVAGAFYFLRIAQDATGSRIVTWPASVKFSDGLITTLTTTASKVDCVGFYYDGTDYLAWFVARSISV